MHKKTALQAIYGETGRFPLFIDIVTNLLKYWSRLCKQPVDSLLYISLMENIKIGKGSWSSSIFHLLDCLGLDKFKDPRTTSVEEIPILNIKKTLKTHYQNSWAENLKSGNGKGLENSKLRTYYLFKTEHYKEPYLDFVKKKCQHRTALARFRTSSHKLEIEIGRYHNIDKDKRICKLCNSRELEEEIHMFSVCSAFDNSRSKLFNYLSTSCIQFPLLNNREKFIWAMSNPSPEICITIAKYIYECFESRESLLKSQSEKD